MTSLIASKVIHVTAGVTVAFAAALIVLDRVGWRITSATFDRERLITNTK